MSTTSLHYKIFANSYIH